MLNFRSLWNSLIRSWKAHAGIHFMTLTVLTSTYVVVLLVYTVSMNLGQVISAWGDSIKVVAYLENDVSAENLSKVQETFSKINEIQDIQYISSQLARERFTQEMSTLSFKLFDDPELKNVFPASFQLSFGSSLSSQNLKNVANKISEVESVAEVSYGQNWIQNYSSIVNVFSKSGWILTVVLLLGSLLVIANSIRVSIHSRQEEIEIMELVGASESMIRTPFVFEGATMGAFSVLLALAISFGLYQWESSFLKAELGFTGVVSYLQFIGFLKASIFIFLGAATGALASFICVRNLNTGWSALRRVSN